MDDQCAMISIIIPAYNTGGFILRALESIKHQTYRSYEIIVINDGSTDNTQEVAEKFAASQANMVVLYQDNKGVSNARNRGIRSAKGEFVCFLDSDDTYHPQFLEKMVTRQRETSGDIIYCGFNRIGYPKNIIGRMDFREGNIVRSYMDGRNYFYFPGMLVKKEFLLLNKIEFEEGRTSTEDYFFTVQILNNAYAYAVKENLFNYHYRENSATNKRWETKHWLSEIGGLKKIYEYLRNNYHQIDKAALMRTVKYKVFRQEMNYLNECLINWKYKNIKYYLINNDFSVYDEFLSDSNIRRIDKKKYKILKRNSFLHFFIGTLYYKYFRINFKKIWK